MRPHAKMIKLWADHPELVVMSKNGDNNDWKVLEYTCWDSRWDYKFKVPFNFCNAGYYKVTIKNISECTFKIFDEVSPAERGSIAKLCSEIKDNSFVCKVVNIDEIEAVIIFEMLFGKKISVNFWNISNVEYLSIVNTTYDSTNFQIKTLEMDRMEELENMVKDLVERVKSLETKLK